MNIGWIAKYLVTSLCSKILVVSGVNLSKLFISPCSGFSVGSMGMITACLVFMAIVKLPEKLPEKNCVSVA